MAVALVPHILQGYGLGRDFLLGQLLRGISLFLTWYGQ